MMSSDEGMPTNQRQHLERQMRALGKIDEEQRLLRLKAVKEADRKRKADDELARKLKPESEYQTLVESRLTSQTTLMLSAAIRACVAKPGLHIKWVCVQKHHARDVMGRTYPLALQMGFIAIANDARWSLTFATGSSIEFTWPGKAL